MEKQIKDMMVKSVLCSQVIEMEGPKVSHIETQFRGCSSFSSQGYISAKWITSKTPAGNIDEGSMAQVWLQKKSPLTPLQLGKKVFEPPGSAHFTHQAPAPTASTHWGHNLVPGSHPSHWIECKLGSPLSPSPPCCSSPILQIRELSGHNQSLHSRLLSLSFAV